TRTLPQRAVYTAVQADMCSLINGVQTQEQLTSLRRGSVSIEQRDRVRDPPVINRKGRPSTARLTGATEGRPHGEGARIQGLDQSQGTTRRQNRCSRCHLVGHNRTSCPRGH
ncbi:hypothetical protein B0H16DRAFT_1338502, partial [Mycena metata]